jgi:hypothetical protein
MNSLAENERELLFQFLAGYWYDRAEEDEVIVAQYVADVSPEELAELVRVVRKFIDSPCPSAEKSAFILRWPGSMNARGYTAIYAHAELDQR